MAHLAHSTNTLGIAALLIAAMIAGSLSRKDWLAIAALLVAMALVIATGAHWMLHDTVRAMLMNNGDYAGHAGLQIAIMVAVLLAVGVAGVRITLSRRGARRWAWLTVMALIALFCVQAISIHGIDGLLGRGIGPVMLVGWAWLAGAAVITLAALHARLR